MDLLHQLLGPDIKAALLIILNLIVIESLLSVDNAAVLATMVLDLPKEQRNRALRYGIIGAYVLRGTCLLLASYLVSIWWLKSIGGLYLLYLAFDHFKGKLSSGGDDAGGDESVDKSKNWLYRSIINLVGTFWATVALVEIMDLAFSIDNIFAVVAFTNNIFLICLGVFIGILAMRFVAQAFVKLMEKFTFLESIAFILIAFLGLKLSATLYTHIYPTSSFAELMESKNMEVFVSIFTISIFVLPVLTSILFNFPKRNSERPEMSEAAEDVLDQS